MTKYLLLYTAPVSAQDQMGSATPEQAQAGMDAWNTWGAKAGAAIVDFGAPVAPAGSVGAASAGGGDAHIGGFSIMEADSREALDELLDGHPHLMLDGAGIEIHELLAVPGM